MNNSPQREVWIVVGALSKHDRRIEVTAVQNGLHSVKRFFGNHGWLLALNFKAVLLRDDLTGIELIAEDAAHGLRPDRCFLVAFALLADTLVIEYFAMSRKLLVPVSISSHAAFIALNVSASFTA